MARRLLALVFIFACTSAAWIILGATIFYRTYNSDSNLRNRVASIWGGSHEQRPPRAIPVHSGLLPLEKTRISTAIELDHRQKGLLWYNTYKVAFEGAYTFRNNTGLEQEVSFVLPLPDPKAVYDGLQLQIDGKLQQVKLDGHAAITKVNVAADSTVTFTAAYRSQGLDRWRYNFGDPVSGVNDFELAIATNFANVDFSDDALAPTSKRRTAAGWDLVWKYSNLVSGSNISLDMPARLQPGQLAGEISYFAPVSLFFFLFLMLIITTQRGIDLHPMNYFFLAASFFAFHLLLAYLADHVDIHLAFLISSMVSIGLVVSYLRIVIGSNVRFPRSGGSTVRLLRALFLRVLSRRFHGTRSDHRSHRYSFSRNANDRSGTMEQTNFKPLRVRSRKPHNGEPETAICDPMIDSHEEAYKDAQRFHAR